MTDNNSHSIDQNNHSNDLYLWTSARLLDATQSVNGRWYHNSSYQASSYQASSYQASSYQANSYQANSYQASNHHNTESAPNTSVTVNATRITTDTRKIQEGDIFLALLGENFDGHDYVDIALQKGAVAAIVSHPNTSIDLPQLVVYDTRLALGKLAAYRRAQHPNVKIIAITGSSGKTSVKEMLRSIFAPLAPTLVTRGNLNNDLGVPMMLLELKDSHRYAILELGANHVGEIAYTTKIARPDVACILNIGTAHLGEFGGRDNIAKTKAEIYQTLSEAAHLDVALSHDVGEGKAIVPLDDDYFNTLYELASQYTNNIIGFGWRSNIYANINLLRSLIYATEVHTDTESNTFNLHIKNNCYANNKMNHSQAFKSINQSNYYEHINLALAGKHNINNALAAAACAHALGIKLTDIGAGLRRAIPAKGRLQWLNFTPHRIIDDTYNANPHSVRVAVDVLAVQHDYKVLVLGDIGELGDATQNEHQQLGHYIANHFIESLFCVGSYAEDTVGAALNAGIHEAYAFTNKADVLDALRVLLANQSASGQTCTVLFKGSRSMTMETLIADLIR